MPDTVTLPGHSFPHVDCPACEEADLIPVRAAEFGLLPFKLAAKVWLGEHRREIAESTHTNYEHMLGPLNKWFGEIPLNEIKYGYVKKYQDWRQEPHYEETSRRTFRAGYSPVNHECSMLAQILDRAGLWIEIEKFYKPLRRPKTRAGRALEPEEQVRLFAAAWSNPYWKVAYCASLLTVNTTAGPGEIRHLHLSDVDLHRKGGDGEPMPTLTIRDGLKTEHRDRVLYLNGTASAVLTILLERAHKLGCHDPEHFLLPHRAYRRGEDHDPNRPMYSWRSAWRSMCKAAGLIHFRMYDLRHDIITRLLENPNNSEQTILEIAGQVTKKMQNNYSHIRMQPKREALEAAETKAPTPQLDFDFEEIALPPPKRPVPVRKRAVRKITDFSA